MDTSVEATIHMKTLIVLAREHEAIERIVTRLEHELDTLTRTGELDGEALQRMLEFFEQAVDGHHQESEERVLLPRLLLRAQGDEAALVRSLLRDHGEQRTFLGILRDNLEGAAYGEPGCRAAVARFGRLYIAHHREHSQWEHTTLFALAKKLLDEEDDLTALRELARLDRDWGSSVVAVARDLEAWLDQRLVAA